MAFAAMPMTANICPYLILQTPIAAMSVTQVIQTPGHGHAQVQMAETRPAVKLHKQTALTVNAAMRNLALDLVLSGVSGRLICLRKGMYDNVPIDVVTGRKKVVDVHKYYHADRLRPKYKSLSGQPLFIMTSDV